MKRLALLNLIFFLFVSVAFAESDEEIIERARASFQKIFLEQASWALPESFWNSGLAESDKEKLVQKLAEDSANCFVNAIVTYSQQTQMPISEIVSDDNTVGFSGDSGSDFMHLFEPCMLRARQSAGMIQ